MRVEKIAEGLWRWSADAPDWRAESEWGREVWSVYWEPASGGVTLIDPLLPPEGSGARARFDAAFARDRARVGGELRVLLTVKDHLRSAAECAARLGATIFAAPATLAALPGLTARPLADARLPPAEIAALPIDGMEPGETAYWLAAHRALVIGDALTGDGAGGVRLAPRHWSPSPEAYDRDLRPSLARLAALAPERLLVSHAEAVAAGAAARLGALLA